MAHIEDRWWTSVTEDGRRKRRKTGRHGRGNRYRVRYIKPDGSSGSASFPDGRKDAAQAFLHKIQTDIAKGSYIDPKRGEVLFETYASAWLDHHGADPSTKEDMERKLRLHIVPFFATKSLASIKPHHVREWLKELDGRLGPASQTVAFAYLKELFNAAIDDDRLPRGKNPCSAKSVAAPKPPSRKVTPWSFERVRSVRAGLGSRYRSMVDVGAGCGLRAGEIFGLSPSDVTDDGESLHVRRQVKIVHNQLVFAPPKGKRDRFVPLPSSVSAALTDHVERVSPVSVTLPWEAPDGDAVTCDLYFTTTRGGPVKRNDFMSHGWGWKRALEAAGIERSQESGMHALRHHYASVLLDAGESIKALSEYLGHKDPAFTLAVYTHLLPASHTRTRAAIDRLWDGTNASLPHGAPNGAL